MIHLNTYKLQLLKLLEKKEIVNNKNINRIYLDYYVEWRNICDQMRIFLTKPQAYEAHEIGTIHELISISNIMYEKLLSLQERLSSSEISNIETKNRKNFNEREILKRWAEVQKYLDIFEKFKEKNTQISEGKLKISEEEFLMNMSELLRILYRYQNETLQTYMFFFGIVIPKELEEKKQTLLSTSILSNKSDSLLNRLPLQFQLQNTIFFNKESKISFPYLINQIAEKYSPERIQKVLELITESSPILNINFFSLENPKIAVYKENFKNDYFKNDYLYKEPLKEIISYLLNYPISPVKKEELQEYWQEEFNKLLNFDEIQKKLLEKDNKTTVLKETNQSLFITIGILTSIFALCYFENKKKLESSLDKEK